LSLHENDSHLPGRRYSLPGHKYGLPRPGLAADNRLAAQERRARQQLRRDRRKAVRDIGKGRRRALRIDDLVHVFEAGEQGMAHGAGDELPHRLELTIDGVARLAASAPAR
jgi:hypothetical protein